MKYHKFWNKYGNCITALLTILVNAIIMGLCFDFYYDLNDDVMMKDVMAGVYAGTPNGHNMQTLYLLGAFISLCYRLFRFIPWYGLFLCLCQFTSLFLIGLRLLKLSDKWQAKAGCMTLLTLFMWGVILPHMVALQYTVTCTMLAFAAIFLFITTEKGLSLKRFIIDNIPSIILVLLAYQLRSEMLLLLFPLICLTGLFRWAEEEKFFIKDNFIKYGAVIGCILVGMLLSRLIDFAAYSSGDWKAAVDFFNSRTEVYDFHYDILTSGEHSEYLSSIGLSDAQQELLANYNFGLDESLDENVMAEIASYAKTLKIDSAADGQSFIGKVLKKGRLYIYRTLHSGDAPYNLIVISGYIFIFIFGLYSALKNVSDRRRWNFLWELMLLGIFRTVLWMYILMKDRDPERITHSLYLAEFMLLMGIAFIQAGKFTKEKKPQDDLKKVTDNRPKTKKSSVTINAISHIYIFVISVICLLNLPHSIIQVSMDAETREAANRGAEAISQYCSAHPGNFYFEDVYSTVSFSQKIFKNVDNSLTNYDIMGGWMCKTPLYKEKLKQFGLENTQDALLYGNGVYLIAELGEKPEDDEVSQGSDELETEDAGLDWLIEYYLDKGYSVSLKKIDLIHGRYAVYQVAEK